MIAGCRNVFCVQKGLPLGSLKKFEAECIEICRRHPSCGRSELTISTPCLYQSGLALETPSEHSEEQESNHADIAIEEDCRVANLYM